MGANHIKTLALAAADKANFDSTQTAEFVTEVLGAWGVEKFRAPRMQIWLLAIGRKYTYDRHELLRLFSILSGERHIERKDLSQEGIRHNLAKLPPNLAFVARSQYLGYDNASISNAIGISPARIPELSKLAQEHMLHFL